MTSHTFASPPELSSLLNNRMDKVLEDYNPSRCQELYSDDSGIALSARSDAVSARTLSVICFNVHEIVALNLF